MKKAGDKIPPLFFIFHPLAHNPIRLVNKYPEQVFGWVREEIQEQTRRVCDAASAIIAEARSIRKRSAGYAMLLKSLLPQIFPAILIRR